MACQHATALLGTSRCLVSALSSWASHAAAFQFHSTAAFSAEAQARTAEPASTSGRGNAASGKNAGRAPSKPASAGSKNTGSSPSSGPNSAAAAAAAATAAAKAQLAAAAAGSHLAPSRMAQYARTILHRELMLKLRPRSWDGVPRLLSVEATIQASETQLERDVVEKWELLLYSLALEHLTGRPTTFVSPANKHLITRAAGVSVLLDARTDPDATYDFLEKLVYVLLPNQVGFEGVTPPTLVGPPAYDKAAVAAAAKKAALDHRVSPLLPHATEFKVSNLLQYPDFEQNFAMFEPLRGMRVRLVMEGASAEDCTALLTGLSLPVLSGSAAETALEEVAQASVRRPKK